MRFALIDIIGPRRPPRQPASVDHAASTMVRSGDRGAGRIFTTRIGSDRAVRLG